MADQASREPTVLDEAALLEQAIYVLDEAVETSRESRRLMKLAMRDAEKAGRAIRECLDAKRQAEAERQTVIRMTTADAEAEAVTLMAEAKAEAGTLIVAGAGAEEVKLVS